MFREEMFVDFFGGGFECLSSFARTSFGKASNTFTFYIFLFYIFLFQIGAIQDFVGTELSALLRAAAILCHLNFTMP